jgi:virginiamycin B lyase
MPYHPSAFCDRRRQVIAFFVSIGLAVSSLVVPWVASTASASTPVVTNYTGTGIDEPLAITAGPDGALWFTNQANNSIGRITTGGVVTNYTGTGISGPDGITVGPDGALWFANLGNSTIGRITTGGVVTNYIGTSISGPEGITAGPDGALWFTNQANNSIGRITTGGVVTNYTATSIDEPVGIAVGPDGALWFTNFGANSIGRITTGGVVTNYTATSIAGPIAIAAGPDGALWFTNVGNNSIGRITTGGVVTNYTGTGISEPQSGITTGPDGALWFTNLGTNSIGRITTGGVVTTYTGTGISGPTGIAVGPDGALWFTNYQNNSIGRITTGSSPPPTTSVLIPSNGTTLSGSTTLDASASNAISVEFRLFGGVYGYNAPVLCTATATIYGWLCSWNTATVPSGSYTLLSEAFGAGGSAFSSGVSITVNNPPPTTSVLIPSNGATLSGSTTLDASASNATTVEFRLFGGVYGYNAPVLCTATATIYGWLCTWNTATVPSGSYTLLSEAFGAGGSAFSPVGVNITVHNPASLVDLTGSFSGTTSFTSGTGCAELEQVFDATYAGSSAVGSVTLHLDGCVFGAPFTYTGTFTITTSVGTLAGNVAGTLNNPVTSPPPYVYDLTLTIVSGTGSFSGTTGAIPVSIQWLGANPGPMTGSVGVT